MTTPAGGLLACILITLLAFLFLGFINYLVVIYWEYSYNTAEVILIIFIVMPAIEIMVIGMVILLGGCCVECCVEMISESMSKVSTDMQQYDIEAAQLEIKAEQ
jgi:hypothetical protein